MKTTKMIIRLMMIAIVFLSFASCSDDDPVAIQSPKTIVQLASADPNLSILVQALTKANLVSDVSVAGPITVFAPTNAAFTAFLTAKGFANLDAVPVDVLKQILLNHVVVGNVKAADLPVTGYFKSQATFGTTMSKISNYVTKTTSASGALSVNINGSIANFGANVITADLSATNGTVHVVNGVIAIPNLVNHAIANPLLSTLVTVLTSTSGVFGDQSAVLGVVANATTAVPLTVFAPVNNAFATAIGTGGFANGATQTQVSNVLKYHVVAGTNVLAGTLTEGQVVSTAFTPQTFTVTLVGGAQITDKSTTKAKIILTDIQAGNGVVHVLDKVLQPTL